MAIDVRNLFKIVGEEGPALRRVEEAMEWLLSPKAKGIGQKLLHDAHAVHGKPVTIIATALEQNGHYPLEGHIVKINPKHIAGVSLKGAGGASHAMSVERALAHELVHAAEPMEKAIEMDLGLSAIKTRAEAATMSRFSQEEVASHNVHLISAMEAPDYHTARQHIANYVDRVALPQQEEIMKHLHGDPEFSRYVSTMEAPAVAVENRVAALRGEPLRADYATAHEVAPEAMREMMIDELANTFEIHQKPCIELQSPQRADGKRWAEALGDRTGRELGG